jgi:histidine triad (HIT) family protein
MTDCIYCKIIKGDLPSTKIYEDDDFIAILDLKPLTFGHTTVIPKIHTQWIYEIEKFTDYFALVQKIAKHYQKAFNTEKIDLLVSGSQIPHAHVNILPQGNGIWEDTKKFNREKQLNRSPITEEERNNLKTLIGILK